MDQHAVAAYFHIELAQEVLAQQRIPVRAAGIACAHAQAADHQGGHAHLLGHHHAAVALAIGGAKANRDRKSTRLNSSHSQISYAVFCLKKKKKKKKNTYSLTHNRNN